MVVNYQTEVILYSLNFTSLTQLDASPSSSTFLTSINSTDDSSGPIDTLILFSFADSVPLKVFKLSSVDPICRAQFVSLEDQKEASVLLVTKQGFLQWVLTQKRKKKHKKITLLESVLDTPASSHDIQRKSATGPGNKDRQKAVEQLLSSENDLGDLFQSYLEQTVEKVPLY
jgi:hypothetical protein